MIAHKDHLPVYHADYEKILTIVQKGSKVLDLGCGNGELLYRLIHENNVHGRGVEINEQNILQCITKGLPVFQGNIDEGLAEYQDQSYDYVILNQTLQVTHKPEFVMREMLRVGRHVIVSFPNFAYWHIRSQLFFKGSMPKTELLPFEWYDTPNIRLLTVKDFRKFCRKHTIRILQQLFFNNISQSCCAQKMASYMPNLFATEGLFVITAH